MVKVRSYNWQKRIAMKREFLLRKTCEELHSYLKENWGNLTDTDQLFALRVMIEEKNCSPQFTAPLLRLLSRAKDPYYRGQALLHLSKIENERSRDVLIQAVKEDPDEIVREMALIYLTDVFRNQKDLEIIALALQMYDNSNSSVSLRLAAGAAMMYQLGIPHDENGQPPWWDDNEEDLAHPAIQKAVAQARQLVTSG